MDANLKKTIQINPEFLKLPSKGGRTKKNREDGAEKKEPKPIKIRTTDKKPESDKTIKRRALNYIRKQQEERYKRLAKGLDNESGVRVESNQTYAEEFKSDFDDSLAFLQKLADQNAQKIPPNMNATLKQYPPVTPNSLLYQDSVLSSALNGSESVSLVEPAVFQEAIQPSGLPSHEGNPSYHPRMVIPPPPMYGCLKGGRLPTYRTAKNFEQRPSTSSAHAVGTSFTPNPLLHSGSSNPSIISGGGDGGDRTSSRLTPEQQRAELKQFLNQRKLEKERVEKIKQHRQFLKPHKKQKRITTRTFRVGKSKHYARVGVLLPNKTIRNQVLAKKQAIRETPVEDMRKYLIKKGLIRVGSSCPNDVLRKMYESSMMMCGELQNHNPDNLLYNYLHNAI